MSDPKRLLDEGSPFLRSVLGSLDDETPPRDLDRKILAAMAAVPTASASASASTATTGTAGAATASSWLRPRAIVGAVAAVGVGVALVAALGSSDRPGPTRDVASAPGVPRARVEATNPAPAAPAPETTVFGVSPDSLPTAAPTVARPPTTPSSTLAPSAPKTAVGSATPETASIEREVQLLDRVKAALGNGSAVDAIGGLDAYDAEFPGGTLRPEAAVLRVRALLLRGDRAGAEAVGEAFLATQPNGVHAKRIRVLLGK